MSMENLLEVRNLSVAFETERGFSTAVDDISFTIPRGSCVGIVGESGCGKSVTAMSLVRLLPRPTGHITGGQIMFNGEDVVTMPHQRLRELRGGRIGFIFQEPMSAMDPLMKIGAQVEETLRIHTRVSAQQRKAWALEALSAVELPDPEAVYEKYPHELSGGMLQRAMIAAASVSKPSLLILDEPTTALDVTIQAQILVMLGKLNRDYGISMLFISHNLNVVRKLCRKVAVMQRGVVVEEGSTEEIFFNPQHPYTQHLIECIPGRSRLLARSRADALD